MVEYFASFVFDREPHLSFSDGVIADRIPKGLYYMSTPGQGLPQGKHLLYNLTQPEPIDFLVTPSIEDSCEGKNREQTVC